MQTSKILDFDSNLLEIQSISKKKLKKKRSLFGLNSCLIALEFIMFIVLFNALFHWRIEGEIPTNYLTLMFFILIVFTTLSLNRSLFRLSPPYSWVSELFQLFKVIFLTFMIAVGILFLLKVSVDFSRAVISLFFVGMLSISWGVRLLKRGVLSWLAYKHILTKNVIIVGAGKIGFNIYSRFKTSKGMGYQVVGYLDDHKKGKEILGKLKDFDQVINSYEIDEVVITIPSERDFVYKVLKSVQRYRIKVKIIPDLYDLVTTKVGFEQVELFPFVEVAEDRIKGWHAVTKRVMDTVLSFLGIVILFPLFALVWVAIKIDSRGPAIFRQKRMGKEGEIFFIYKYRTMVLNAEEKLRRSPDLYKKYLKNNYKLEPEEDPRITRLGRFLRKSSLDELPQLFNVLKGEMSLVGPRPVVEEELKEYEQNLHDFLSVKPGITGYWQVSGRSDISYPERIDIELYYVYNQSLVLDVKILIKTFITVVKRKGAY
jgi:exopolysaccharide biosynthesis polyprenyl glycosylphosphotransferase